MNLDEITFSILDLISEDVYGSWELWGGVVQDSGGNVSPDLRQQFVNTVHHLVQNKKIHVWHHKSWSGNENTYTPTDLDEEQLTYEMEHYQKPDPDTYYWFEATETGKSEYERLYRLLNKKD